MTRRVGTQAVLLGAGVGAYAYGVSQLRRSLIGLHGLLASANAWFTIAFVILLIGFALELRRPHPRSWLLIAFLIALIVAIHATVPILYGTPEYAWVYKHIGVAQALGRYGRITDSSSIYQEWPPLFAAVAALSALGHVNTLAFAAWAPLAFELADAVLLLAIFRSLSTDRRVAYTAVLLFEGLVSWVGQDYLSPQAFAYMLWLGVVLALVRWLRAPEPPHEPASPLARLRAPLLWGLAAPPPTTRRLRTAAVIIVAAVYLAIVATHQLTPYPALASVGVLTVLDLLRPRWLVLLLGAIALAYLAPRYNLIAHNFGGLFSGGNPIENASGSAGTYHAGAEALTAWIVRALAATMWLTSIASIFGRRRRLGTVLVPAALAFTPFVLLVFQRYGGEAVYRVYLFSAPWCAWLIARGLADLGALRHRWWLGLIVCAAALGAGLQGLYGPVAVNSFTPTELTASRWLYSHIPRGALIILPDENFPVLETANDEAYDLQVMPADPQIGETWLDEGNLPEIEAWVGDLGHTTAYIPVSGSMAAYAAYFGAPAAYSEFVSSIRDAAGWTVVYRSADTLIYRFDLDRASVVSAPRPTATVPARMVRARAPSPSRR